MNEKEPNATWSLDELGHFCQARSQRMASDAWETGKAMALAKEKSNYGEFGAWKRKWGYSDAMACRYMKLYKKHKTPDSLNGEGIMEALRAANIVAPKPAKPPKPEARKPEKSEPSKAAALGAGPPKDSRPAPVRYPWAVPDSTDFALNEGDEHHEPELDATTDTMLRLEIEKLPQCFETLKRQIDWIGEQDKEVRIRVWPADHNEQIRAGSDELQAALRKLVGMIPA